jgi:hypothetical protein
LLLPLLVLSCPPRIFIFVERDALIVS